MKLSSLVLGILGVRRSPPCGYLMNQIEVMSSGSGEFNISLYPVNCSVPASLLSVRNGAADVTRVTAASPAVTGVMTLMYGDQLISGTLRCLRFGVVQPRSI